MSAYYPVFLNLKGRRCLIIGGGAVAQRKLPLLLECGARVTIVSPSLTPEVKEKARRGEVHWEAREYRQGDLQGAFLAIAATDDPKVNRAISREAQAEGVLLNVVDQPALCTFIAPSVVRRGEVMVAISTGGLSPALARKMRETLAASKALEYADLAELLSQARREMRRKGVRVRAERWQECIDEGLLSLVQGGRRQEALELLLSRLEGMAKREEVR